MTDRIDHGPDLPIITMKNKLTVKQQRFVDFYDGNATDAARKAGYKGNTKTLAVVGDENLKKLNIANAIAAREKQRNGKHIATRQERQEFWTACETYDIRNFYSEGKLKPINDLDDTSARLIQSIKITKDGDEIEYKLPDRLKASELLGRSEADFTDKVKDVSEAPEGMSRLMVGLLGAVYVKDVK